MREKAAQFVKDGQDVPSDYMEKYRKTIEMKLGGRNRWSQNAGS